MDKIRNPRWAHLATVAFCGLGFMSTALAAPPISQRAFASPVNSQRGSSRLDMRTLADARMAANMRTMDLHSHPSDFATLAAADKSPVAFPSGLHRQAPGVQEQEQMRLPELGAQAPQGRIKGRAEEFVQRVHREGLPLARLWENKSALVSLGLNQRGKPGLWIVQKTH